MAENNKINVMLDEGAIMPTRANPTDAGMDLYTRTEFTVPARKIKIFPKISLQEGSMVINTGVHIQIPEGYVGFLKSKSGLNVKAGLLGEGVIDSGYNGPVVVKLYNNSDKPYTFKAGEKISQLVILPCLLPECMQVDSFEETARGDKGFGSSGK